MDTSELPLALLGDLRRFVPPPWSEMILVAVSFVCGGAIGIERERQEKPAGLRTLILICIGATTFTLASLSPVLGGFEKGRIAAQVVTGVGFLGAGSIIQQRLSIKGLTTAATVWACAAVGIIVGAGYAVAGFALACAILVTLTLVNRIESVLAGRCTQERLRLVYRTERGRTLPRIQQVIDQSPACQLVGRETPYDATHAQVPLEYCTCHREHRSVLAQLADLEGVVALEGVDAAENPLAAPAPATTKWSLGGRT